MSHLPASVVVPEPFRPCSCLVRWSATHCVPAVSFAIVRDEPNRRAGD